MKKETPKTYGGLFVGMFESLIKAALIVGLIVGIAVAGLLWGGYEIYRHFNKSTTVTVTNVVTVPTTK